MEPQQPNDGEVAKHFVEGAGTKNSGSLTLVPPHCDPTNDRGRSQWVNNKVVGVDNKRRGERKKERKKSSRDIASLVGGNELLLNL